MNVSAAEGAHQVVASYQLLRRLGRGGTSEVWLGRHTVTDGIAAVKLLRSDRPRRDQLAFVREQRAIARLTHPNVVRLFDFGPDHLVMAYVEGSDLQRRLRAPLDPSRAIHIALQIGSALAHAHVRGVVHGDVKPANILIDANGTAFLVDFGVASILDDVSLVPARGGTPAFMAPEQSRGRAQPATDQFALARTVVEMLAGSAGAAVSLDALPSLPAPLHDALERALQTDPGARWPSVDAFVAALSTIDVSAYPRPVRLLPERRSAAAFRWMTKPCAMREVAAGLWRAEHRLSALEAAGVLDRARVDAFRTETAYADMAWSLFGNSDRLGPLDDSMALARARQVVVLMHGWLATRETFADVAAAICRDNGHAVVLVPDLHGFGETTFASPSPPLDKARPAAIAEAVLALLDLVGIRRLPRVLVGHSLSGLGLLAVDPEAAGPQTVRVIVTPYVLTLAPFVRFLVRNVARVTRLLAKSRLLYRLFARLMTTKVGNPGLTDSAQRSMRAQFLTTPPRVLAAILDGVAATKLGAAAMRGVIQVLGDTDPSYPRRLIGPTLKLHGGAEASVHRIATGGHYPHLEDRRHPEWTARNQDELVRLIDGALDECDDLPAQLGETIGGETE